MSSDTGTPPVDDTGRENHHVSDHLNVFRAAFDAMPYGVLVAAEDGTTLFANAIASATLA